MNNYKRISTLLCCFIIQFFSSPVFAQCGNKIAISVTLKGNAFLSGTGTISLAGKRETVSANSDCCYGDPADFEIEDIVMEVGRPYLLGVSNSITCLSFDFTTCPFDFLIRDWRGRTSIRRAPFELHIGRQASGWSITPIPPKGASCPTGSGGGGSARGSISDRISFVGSPSDEYSTFFVAGCGCTGTNYSSIIGTDISLGSRITDGLSAGMLFADFELSETYEMSVDGGVQVIDNPGVSLASYYVVASFSNESISVSGQGLSDEELAAMLAGDQVNIFRNSEGHITQVATREAVIFLEETAPMEVTVSSYHYDSVQQQPDETYVRIAGAEPYVQNIVRNVNGDVTQVEFERIQGGVSTLFEQFTFNADDNAIIETTEDRQTQITEEIFEDAGIRIERTTDSEYVDGVAVAVLSDVMEI